MLKQNIRIDKGERFLLAVTHYARKTVIEYARKKGVEIIHIEEDDIPTWEMV